MKKLADNPTFISSESFLSCRVGKSEALPTDSQLQNMVMVGTKSRAHPTRLLKRLHVVVKDRKAPHSERLLPARWIKETTSELILVNGTKEEVRTLNLFDQT
ncbi:MAG: hypothetical protein GY795_09195, partial [Desulfobacterales bacterium]|nr:hypothetical protein [Desulfobacterales bacterium]